MYSENSVKGLPQITVSTIPCMASIRTKQLTEKAKKPCHFCLPAGLTPCSDDYSPETPAKSNKAFSPAVFDERVAQIFEHFARGEI